MELALDLTKNIVPSEQKLALSSVLLLNALIENESIQHIIDIGYTLLGNPIHVTDLSHNILAHTKNMEVEDPVWNELMKHEYGSYYIISKTNMEGVYEQIRNSQAPFISLPKDTNIPILQGCINIDGKPAGYLTIPGSIKSFEETDIEISALLCNVLSLEMQKNKFFRNTKGLMYEYFLADLLDGKMRDSSVINERIKYLGLDLKENIYVITIRMKESVTEPPTQIDLRKDLQEIISGSKTILYNDEIIMVVSYSKNNFFSETELKNLTAFCSKNHMCAGISRCFLALENIQEYYTQSVKAIEFGTQVDKQKAVFYYENYTFYHLMDICAEHKTLSTFCHPSLFTLAEYDMKHCTDFVKSLYTYLTNHRSVVVTADLLHVHRNTLRYRMSKISEIMNLDINDEDVFFHLLHSFKILKFDKLTKLKKHFDEDNSKHMNYSFL